MIYHNVCLQRRTYKHWPNSLSYKVDRPSSDNSRILHINRSFWNISSIYIFETFHMLTQVHNDTK